MGFGKGLEDHRSKRALRTNHVTRLRARKAIFETLEVRQLLSTYQYNVPSNNQITRNN
jgi:hypothetical protein